MAGKQKSKVDPIDALSAIADFMGAMRRRKISIGDLAVLLDWDEVAVEEFLFSGEIPEYAELVAVAKELNVKLDF
jgi:hypothetical protein